MAIMVALTSVHAQAAPRSKAVFHLNYVNCSLHVLSWHVLIRHYVPTLFRNHQSAAFELQRGNWVRGVCVADSAGLANGQFISLVCRDCGVFDVGVVAGVGV